MYTYEQLNQWSHSDLVDEVSQIDGINNAYEWDKDDLIDFLLTFNYPESKTNEEEI